MPAPVAVAERVRRLVSQLEEADLRPSAPVSAAFERLVGLALHHRGPAAERVIAELGPDAARVRRLCALGEEALERHWAARVAAAPDPCGELARFPYRGNYERLVALELAIVRGVGGAPRHATVIGSGALPLTGIELASRHDLTVLLVDRDRRALQVGDHLARALGLGDRVTSRCAEAGRDVLDVRDTDLVVHGALVGADVADKRTILGSVSASMRPGSYLVVRSAAGLRTLLYPPASIEGVAGLRTLLEAHPHDDIVNSVLVAVRD